MFVVAQVADPGLRPRWWRSSGTSGARRSSRCASWPIVYIDLFRGIPLLLVILLLGFGVPALQLDGVPTDPVFWGVTALVLSYSAYTAEVYRAGIDSVHESQRSAARALGLTQWQALRFAVLPQAVRNVIPALLNGLVSLQKDVALVSVLGIREAVREAQIYTSRTFNYTSYVAATVLFLLASVPVARFADWYTARDRRRRARPVDDADRDPCRAASRSGICGSPSGPRSCWTASTCRWPSTRWWPSSARAAAGSRPSCAASTCSSASTAAAIRLDGEASAASASTPTPCASASASSSRPSTCSPT